MSTENTVQAKKKKKQCKDSFETRLVKHWKALQCKAFILSAEKNTVKLILNARIK